jgi:hypothetical protein
LEFTCRAIRFVSEHGKVFLPLYSFDIHSGNWQHRGFEEQSVEFTLERGLPGRDGRGVRKNAVLQMEDLQIGQTAADLEELFRKYLAKAQSLAEELSPGFDGERCKTTQRDLIPFVYY